MRADPETEGAIFEAVDALFESLANRRPEEALDAFVSDPDVALYGSEVGEVLVGRDALRGFLEHLSARPAGPRFTLEERRASVRGDVAWFTSGATVRVGDTVVSTYRLTGVLERRDGRWLWALFNGSEPVPDRT